MKSECVTSDKLIQLMSSYESNQIWDKNWAKKSPKWGPKIFLTPDTT